MISVFTPTYNRLALLGRLYGSLLRQTSQNFEWIIVDDDSTDDTVEWVQSIENHSPFAIKYKKVPHGGKHRAINVGVQLAAGDYFFPVDSDDYLPDNSIEIISGWIEEIKNKYYLAGIAGLKMSMEGEVIGESPHVPPGKYIECSNIQRYRRHLLGDKAEIYRTSLLKQYPFPEFDGEFFVTERIVWDRIAQDGFQLRWYNMPIYTCEYQTTGLSNSGANSLAGHIRNYKGYLAFVKQTMEILEPLEAVTYFSEYNKTARGKSKTIKERALDIQVNQLYYFYYLYCKMPLYYVARIVLRGYLKIQTMLY